MHYRISALAGLLILGSSGLALAQSMSSPAPMMSPAAMTGAMKPLTVKLYPQNKSGETATATLSQVGDDVKVVVTTKGGPSDPQPIHIHEGSCAKLNPAPKYPLTTVQDATSTTTLKGLQLSSLENGGYAINIHHSTSDIPTYYACGDIPKMAM
jgi:hypothetical protein